jgi:serine protease Do
MVSEVLNRFGDNAGLSESLRRVAKLAQKSTVQVRVGRRAGGSGTIWADGLVVTNAHVAVRSPIEVVSSNGSSMAGEVISRRPRQDLALIRVEGDGLFPAEIGDSSTVRPGDFVFSLGNPMGMTNSVAIGVVHAVGQPAPGQRHALVQADIRLAPGYSGGPMLDAAGQVIGVNTMISGGLGLAIPSNAVASFLAESSRPRLGVALQPVTFPTGRQSFQAGLLVTEVLDDSRASTAGICVGDIIVAANDHPTPRPQELADVLGDAPILRVHVLRGSSVLTVEVLLTGGQPSSTKRAA